MDRYGLRMESTASRVAAVVKETMTARNISQVQLAEATGIPRVTLIRRLNGSVAFSVDELDRIAAHLGVSVSDLLVVAA